MIKVIWIYSKSVNVVDAKLTVLLKYESDLKENTIFIHHALENAENVINFCAYKQVKSLGTAVDSISNNVPINSLGTILEAAADKVLPKDTIRDLCYGIFLQDKGDNVGSTENASYHCRSLFTVRRLKEQLVNKILNKIANTLGSEICSGILKHIQTKIKIDLEQNCSYLEFEISNSYFATITDSVGDVVVSFFSQLLGIIFTVSTLVMTSVWSVDVNSREWRQKIADDIYYTINKKKVDIMRKIMPQVEQMCFQTEQELITVSKKIDAFKGRIGHTEQNTCK